VHGMATGIFSKESRCCQRCTRVSDRDCRIILLLSRITWRVIVRICRLNVVGRQGQGCVGLENECRLAASVGVDDRKLGPGHLATQRTRTRQDPSSSWSWATRGIGALLVAIASKWCLHPGRRYSRERCVHSRVVVSSYSSVLAVPTALFQVSGSDEPGQRFSRDE